MVLRHPEYVKKTGVYPYQFCDWSANPSKLVWEDAPPVYLLLLLLLLLLPQLQFSLDKVIIHFFVSLLQIDDAHIHYNICFICLLASDPVLLIKLLNNLGWQLHTQMHKYSVRGCYSVDNSNTRTQVRAFHGCNLVDNTSTGAQVWALHGCNLVDDANTGAQIWALHGCNFWLFWTDSKTEWTPVYEPWTNRRLKMHDTDCWVSSSCHVQLR